VEPFEYVLLLVSFVYTLALTHLLMGAARMIRHRRELKFSWPHALWMAFAFTLVILNWISQWDFHTLKTIDLATLGGAIALSVGIYFVSALVTPEFEREEHYDLVAYHRTQGPTYVGAVLALALLAMALNFGALAEGVQSWAEQNLLVAAMLLPAGAALIWRRQAVVQALAPALELAAAAWFLAAYYPKLV
jgi:hypothetical protein